MDNTAEQVISDIKKSIDQYQQELSAVRSLDQPVTQYAPFVVSFVGKFKTGKSSLINALLGMELLPTRTTTCTSVVTRIFRGRKLRAWLGTGGNRQEVSLEEAKKAIQEYQVEDPMHPMDVILEVPVPWLSYGVELRDTPGMDDSAQNGHLETIAMNALEDTDLCICVYDASSMISSKEKERSRYIHQSMGGNVVHIVNRTNLLNNVQQLHEIETLCDQFFGGMKPFEDQVAGTGKYYTVCSSPGMVELAGFDLWLRKIISGKRTFWQKLLEWLFRKMIVTPEKIQLRSIAATGKLRQKSKEIKELAQIQQLLLTETLKEQKDEHSRRKEQLLEEGKEQGAARAKEIRNAIPEATADLSSLLGLEQQLGVCIDTLRAQKPFKWKTLCPQASSECVQGFFVSNWNGYCVSGKQDAISRIDAQFVIDAIHTLTFPGYAYISKWAGLRKVDNTVPNTMEFVRNQVLPLLQQSLREAVIEVAAKEKEALITKAAQTATGLENTISELENLQKELQQFL